MEGGRTEVKFSLHAEDMILCIKKTLKVVPVGKNSATNAGDTRDVGLIPGLGKSLGEGHGNHSSILARKIHGQRSLVGYSPGGQK